MNALLDYYEALARTLAAAPTLQGERVALGHAVGRVLAETVQYPSDLPPFAQATMDGYAVAGAAPEGARFSLEGESRAGAPWGGAASAGGAAGESATASSDGTPRTVSISTGAALPATFDTVVPWEHVARDGATITLLRPADLAQWTRRAGEDAKARQDAVVVGTRLAPRHLAPLAVAERPEVSVARRPRVLLLVTGDELRAPGEPNAPGMIVDANTPLLVALAQAAGAHVTATRVPDRAGALEEAIGTADAPDAIVTVGGAAEGEHDHVARALAALSAEVVYRGVAIKPGKPVALARLGKKPLLALPGNPGSAFVTFVLLGMPLLRRMQVDRAAAPPFVRARLVPPAGRALRAPAERLAVFYGALAAENGVLTFVAQPPAPSGAIPPLAHAAALALVPAGTSSSEGDVVVAVDVERA